MSAKIAIVGLESSGKSIFTACFAKKFERMDDKGRAMVAMNYPTKSFTDKSWSDLRSGEWLPSTPPGSLFNYAWKINGPQMDFDLHVVDAPGHDIRSLFTTGSIHDKDGNHQALAKYCREADIVLLLINLKDYEGIANQARQTANDWAPQAVLQEILNRPGTHCAILLTQMDIYEPRMNQVGSPEKLLRDILPQVHAQFVSSGKVPVLPVASVNQTVATVRDGIPMKVPAPNFESRGFDAVMDWVAKTCSKVKIDANQETRRKDCAEAKSKYERLKNDHLALQKQIDIIKNEHVNSQLSSLYSIIAISSVLILVLGFAFNRNDASYDKDTSYDINHPEEKHWGITEKNIIFPDKYGWIIDKPAWIQHIPRTEHVSGSHPNWPSIFIWAVVIAASTGGVGYIIINCQSQDKAEAKTSQLRQLENELHETEKIFAEK